MPRVAVRALLGLLSLLVWASPRVEAAVVLAHVSFAHHHDHHDAATDGEDAGGHRDAPADAGASRSALAIALHGHRHSELVPEHEHRVATFGQALVLRENGDEATASQHALTRPEYAHAPGHRAGRRDRSPSSLYAHCSLRL